MENLKSQNKTATNRQEFDQSKNPNVEVTKTFNAPVEKVWRAWSEDSLIKQWWGPQGYSAPSAKTDFRVDGKYHYAMKGPDGKVFWSTGVFQEIIPNKKISYTDDFADEQGNVISPQEAGMDDWPEMSTSYVTVTFKSLGNNQTQMELKHEGIPARMHDDCVQGWSSSLDKMKALVETQ